MRTLAFILALGFAASAAGLAAPAAATDFCRTGSIVDVAGQVYVLYDVAEDGYLFRVSVYVESNGEEGLQRGGVGLLGEPDVCQDHPNPDWRVI